MSPSELSELKKIYQSYGFSFARQYETDDVLVFTLKTGYFDNADIVALSESALTDNAFSDYSQIGYACQIRQFLTAKVAQTELFKGFFSVDSIIQRLESDYERFTAALVKPFSDDAKYTYINAPYLINGEEGLTSPHEEIVSRLPSNKPTLFLVEAAAGFGKTCNAYELVKRIISNTEYLPLFSELSRNREARIFKYILLDEIDRTFPVLGSKLVQAEMCNGRVITILDGFDELLRKNEDGTDFENREPMLETIGEYLIGNAKIVLTTRRTVLFEGDAFHDWVNRHTDEFDFVTIKLNEPRINDWLNEDRISALQASGLHLEDISNPVLLSYLRCIPDSEFDRIVSSPDLIVESYFDFMLDREQVRQDLRMSIPNQQEVMRGICEDMMNFGYTSEQRDYIVDHILRHNSKILNDSLINYPASLKPTKEEIANKLASHALLDRSIRESNKIGFINEFVLGHYVSENIIRSQDWLSDDMRFIEPAIISYQPRNEVVRMNLWGKLKNSIEFLSTSSRIDISIKLQQAIVFEMENEDAEGLIFEKTIIGTKSISNFQFNDCIFKNCKFILENLKDVTFLNCKFYGNTISPNKAGGIIYVLGGSGDNDFINSLNFAEQDNSDLIQIDTDKEIQKFVLEKFWPLGRDTIVHKHRPVKGLCNAGGTYNAHQIYRAIEQLKKMGLLFEPRSHHFVEINFDEIAELRNILGRGVIQ
ncbi:MAG: hypothetical protein HOO85_03005 [Methylotenera sp.]|nr:hypothetical protein [Methylotenera sp.]